MKRMMWKVMLVATLAAGVLLAQGDKTTAPTAEPEYFRLNFVLKEVENGKVVNSRNYSMVVVTGDKDRASIRAGTKISMQTGPAQPPQIQYFDVGVNIDCGSVRRLQNRLAMSVEVGLLTALPPQDKVAPAGYPFRNTRWNSPVVVHIGKPTTLFSSDDLTSTRTLQLELTATPVK